MWNLILSLWWTFSWLTLSFLAGLLSAIYAMEKHIISLREGREQEREEHHLSLRDQEKKEEKCVPLEDAERLWRMLDDINSLDNYCRNDDKNFRILTKERVALRLEIATPSGGFLSPLLWHNKTKKK